MISHEEFAKKVNEESGASRTFRGKKEVMGPGVMVAKEGAEEKSAPPLTPGQAKQYYDKHSPGADVKDAHGGWKQGGIVFQDSSRKYESLDEARDAGRVNRQIAGWDLGKGVEEHGVDILHPEGGNVYFAREMPGDNADWKWRQTSKTTSEYEKLAPKPKRGDREDLAHVNRGATRRTKTGKTVPVTLNEVMATISKNRRRSGI
jgi:hypothetical protein